jgi:hypothetical protein
VDIVFLLPRCGRLVLSKQRKGVVGFVGLDCARDHRAIPEQEDVPETPVAPVIPTDDDVVPIAHDRTY